MTELVLIVALEGLALALAVLIARVHAPRADAIGTTRVISALERASAAFLARERLRLAPFAGAVALVLLALEAAQGRPAAGMARAAGVLLGAALGAVVAVGGARAGGLAGGATLDAARSRFDAALSSGLRLGGAAGLGAQAVGGLGVIVLLAGERALGGAVNAGHALGSFTASALPAYGVGVTLVPQMAVTAQAIPARHAVVVPFREPAPLRTIGLVWRGTDARAEAFKLLGATMTKSGTKAGTKAAAKAGAK